MLTRTRLQRSLRIIDRAKDVGQMADGSLFAPKYVENKLKFYPSILEAVVFGADRDRCVAFVNIDMTAVGNWAERNNIAYGSYQELAGLAPVLDMIQSHVEEVNVSLAADEPTVRYRGWFINGEDLLNHWAPDATALISHDGYSRIFEAVQKTAGRG